MAQGAQGFCRDRAGLGLHERNAVRFAQCGIALLARFASIRHIGMTDRQRKKQERAAAHQDTGERQMHALPGQRKAELLAARLAVGKANDGGEIVRGIRLLRDFYRALSFYAFQAYHGIARR